MNKLYIAHRSEVSNQIQTVKQHSEHTAELCRQFSIPILKDMMYIIGLLHDIGKYQESFQLRISGENIQVEHSTCGAIASEQLYADQKAVALLMAYCIAGHHAGIPDGGYQTDTADMTTLHGKMKRSFEDFSAYQEELIIPEVDTQKVLSFLAMDCGRSIEKLIDKFAFFTRYAFSCLTDADSIDTAEFNFGVQRQTLRTDFANCLKKVDKILDTFVSKTELQRSRAVLQKQVFEKVTKDADIYLMNMPTGSGKTLCSIKFALEKAVGQEKKRIIYIIPYNSVIDQSISVFESIFGEDANILRHQSTFSYEDAGSVEDYCRAAEIAMENWDAQLIVTTVVQFFESIYANKRGKLRKLHNMADSILIFDEVHLMPQKYLQPCLEAISYITRYLNSEAVFLTATMPDFPKLISQYAMPESKVLNLVEDTSVFEKFQKCRYRFLEDIELENILIKARNSPSSLIVVNSKKTARQIYEMCSGKKYHLSTYMTAIDRKRVIEQIREDLHQQEKEYPDLQQVLDEKRITVISTSLIEAGVDLDFYTVFRELSGLDSILQAGGRCNREGKRTMADVFVFEQKEECRRAANDERRNITKGLMREFEDITDLECIRAYYDRLFFMKREEMETKAMYHQCADISAIPFQRYAEEFELIETNTIAVVVPVDEYGRKLVESLPFASGGVARKLQKYTCTVSQSEFQELFQQHVLSDYGTGIFCLMNPDYYDPETGIVFEAKDYFL